MCPRDCLIGIDEVSAQSGGDGSISQVCSRVRSAITRNSVQYENGVAAVDGGGDGGGIRDVMVLRFLLGRYRPMLASDDLEAPLWV